MAQLWSGASFVTAPALLSQPQLFFLPLFWQRNPHLHSDAAALAPRVLLGQDELQALLSIPRGWSKERSTGTTRSWHQQLLQAGGAVPVPPQFHRYGPGLTKRCQSHDVPDVALRVPCLGLSQSHWSLHILYLGLSPFPALCSSAQPPVPQTSDFCRDPLEFKGIFSPRFNQTHPNCVWLSLPSLSPTPSPYTATEHTPASTFSSWCL